MQNKTTFIMVAGAVFMLAPFAIDMYLPALPAIATALETGLDQMELTVAILLFGFALGQLILGPVSDAFGRRPILLGGLVIYIVASVLAGTAQSIEQLYIWRFFQALGGAGSVVVFPLVKDRFSEKEGAGIISYIMALTIVAPLVAPIIGGYVLTIAGWQAIFYLLAAMGALTFIAASIVVKPTGNARKPFSMRTIAKSYGQVFGNAELLAWLAAGALPFAGLFAFVAGSPFVYIEYFGVAPEHYGYYTGINALAMMGANLINARLLANIDPLRKMFVGSIVLFLASIILVVFALMDLGLPYIVGGLLVFIAALGFTSTNALVGSLAILPQENGTVSALNGASRFGIGAVSSFLISLTISTDAVPMTMVMAGTAILTLFSTLYLVLAKSRSTHTKVTSHA
ncbi:MAG: Bcr/CflA family drug resistance efflux transporter [Hyphomicrobiales bacterium]|nr:MAG: Bcr/CflA family drug resistance efflux transporter [Hyphomicrobiales bacterium]